MKKILMFLKQEFLEMLPPTIFFFVVFHIITFTRALMAKQYGIPIPSSVAATIGALIVGKAILIADALPFVNWFSQKRLIYNVAWRTFLYIIVVLLFQFLEELIPLISKYGSVGTALALNRRNNMASILGYPYSYYRIFIYLQRKHRSHRRNWSPGVPHNLIQLEE